MSGYTIVAEELREYALYLRHHPANDMAETVDTQARLQGCNPDGFTGLMTPLAGFMPQLAGMVTTLCNLAAARINNVSDAIIATVDDYEHVEAHNEKKISEPMRERTAS